MIPEERETVITYNDDEATAIIYSCQRPIWTKMKKLGIDPTKTYYKDGLPIAYKFKVPKRWIKITKTRIISEENKKALRERAKIHFKAKNVESTKENQK